jgi:predicted Ser/Thr protein kinase
MAEIINHLRNEHRREAKNIDADDQEAIRNLINRAMWKERHMLSKQVMTFMQPGMDVSRRGYRNLNADEKN